MARRVMAVYRGERGMAAAIFEPDQLVNSQWADLHRNHLVEHPLSSLCQAIIEGAIYQIGKGPEAKTPDAVRRFNEDVQWIRDFHGKCHHYPVTFEQALSWGYPALSLDVEVVSRAILKRIPAWIGGTAQGLRPWHHTGRMTLGKGATACV